MSDVFISYSRKNSEFVRILHEALEKSNRKTWVDWEGIAKGTKWWKEIEEGIEGADTFVFVISPDSVASEVCQKEINHAVKNNKQILPIVYKEPDQNFCKSENPAHKAVCSHNFLLFLNVERDTDDFKKSFKELIDTLNLDNAHRKSHTRFQLRALEWDNKKHKDGSLLQDENLIEAEDWLKSGVNKDPKPTDLQKKFVEASRVLRDRNIKQKKLLLGIVYSTIGLVVAIPLTIAGTILGNLHNRQNVVFAQQGQHITGSSKYRLSYTRLYQRKLEAEGSTETLNQIAFGIPIKDNKESIDCIDIGSIQSQELDGDTSGKHIINFNAPKRPGVYYVFFGSQMQYTCEDAKTKFNSKDRQSSSAKKSQTSSIGVVIVGNFVDIIFHWKDVKQALDDNISHTVMSISNDNGLFVALSDFSLQSSDKVTRDPKPIPYPDGTIVKMPPNAAVFLLKGKKRHLIPTMEIVNHCKYNERIKEIYAQELLKEYPKGKEDVSSSEKCWPGQNRAGAYFTWKNAVHLGFYDHPNKSNPRGASDLIAYCTFPNPERLQMYQSAVEVDDLGVLTDNPVDPLQFRRACPMPLPSGYFTWKGASYYSMGESKYCLFPTKQEFVDHQNRSIKDKEPIFGDLKSEPDEFMSLSGDCGK